MFRTRRSIFALFTVVLIALFSVASSATASSETRPTTERPSYRTMSQDDGTISIQAAPESRSAILREWSDLSRRQSAQPHPFPQSSGAPLQRSALDLGLDLTPGTELNLAAGSSPSGLAAPGSQTVARQEFAETWEALEEQAISEFEYDEYTYERAGDAIDAPSDVMGSNGVYTSYPGNYRWQHYRYFPFMTFGKLYIGGGGYCSASVISPNNIIVTAAHCVYDTEENEWYDGWVFVPADRNGYAPYGVFPWESARILGQWRDLPDTLSRATKSYDVALIKLGNNNYNRPVTYYTGHLGRAWNWGYTQSLHSVGYPSNIRDGAYSHICAAESRYWYPNVIGMGCNMMHGSSGGPWLRNFAPYGWGGNNQVLSVVSGGWPDSTWGNTYYGTRFTSGNIVPLCNAEGC